MASYWKEQADAAIKAGYVAGNSWEGMFRKSLKRAKPELVKELGADLKDYIRVQVARAMKQMELMTEQGTAPDAARELAEADLLGTGDNED